MRYRNLRGFTLLELLIFAAIFSIVMVAFITILTAITALQTKQLSVAEVTQQSQFLLQTIQYNVEKASLIEMPQDVATSVIKLRMTDPQLDPTYIYASGTTIYMQQGQGAIGVGGQSQALTSNKVTVSGVSFTKRSNAPSHDSVSVQFTVAYNTQSIKQQFSQAFQVAIARVSAATFDSNVVPSSTATYDLGVSSQVWRSVNNTLYFSGSNAYFSGVNLGVGTNAPTQVLQVAGGDAYISSAGNGIIFKAPNGTSCFKLTITNGGLLATSSVTCT